MQISNILGGHPDPTKVSKRGEPLEAAGARALQAAEASASGAAAGKTTLREILAKYDVTHISPGEFSEMVQKLYKAGTISEGEYQELSGIRSDLESAGIRPDEQINLREFYASKLQQLQREATAPGDGTTQQQLAPVARRRDWIEKFALMQANPAATGVDAVA
jgi:hypothetical protein